MATPMTPEELLAQLEKWDVPYRKLKGWRVRGRDAATGLEFGPVFGMVTHHTGDDAPDKIDRSIIRNGRTGLPGPLAQFGINDDGVVDIHSVGRANHAGGGDPRVLAQVIAESYRKYPIQPRQHTGSSGAVDGNDCFYGAEVYYSGSHKMTKRQYRSLILLWAAICDFYGWTAKSVIGHKEWSDWKSDPGSHDMHQIRTDVEEALELGPPSTRQLPDTRVTKFGNMLDEALTYAEAIPERRKLVADVIENVSEQRARLPER